MFKLTTEPARETFLSSVVGGLAAGGVTAAALFIAFILVALVVEGRMPLEQLPGTISGMLFMSLIVLTFASGLALFPIGPLWVLTVWLLRRGEFTETWIYALAGALVAAYVPLLVYLMRASEEDPGNFVIAAVWFALSGGVGGYVSGGALKRVLGRPQDASE